ncbi:HNH endonuclease [Corynebacterium sp. AOP40-9SA-29]|uniref:HNH endonuclease n=1 Tax=Corynebacterium sp. AOP40-9SA-29 TaxID=3457677 RepID=UPI0040337264
MSMSTLVWAIHQADVQDPVEFGVLCILADSTPCGRPDRQLADRLRDRAANRLNRGGSDIDEAIDRLYARGFIIPTPPAAVPTTPTRQRRKTMSATTMVSVFAADGYQCVACGSGMALSVDHIVPVSKGGTDERWNLQTLCGSCNSRKGNRSNGTAPTP